MLRNGTLILNEDTLYSTSAEEKKQAVHVIVEEGVTSLGVGDFAESPNLVSVILPESLTDLGDLTFMNCHKLQQVNIPDHIKVIREETFFRCSSLKEIKLPRQLETICHFAFWECRNLTRITLPDRVKMVGDQAFGGCRCIDQLIHDYPHLIKHANVSDYKIAELVKIFRENLDNANLFDLAHNLSGSYWAALLSAVPELAFRCPWQSLTGSAWASLLTWQPRFADVCQWNKLIGLYVVDLLRHQPQFAPKCCWKRVTPRCQTAVLANFPHLSPFLDWEKISVYDLFHEYKVSLTQYKLEYVPSLKEWTRLLRVCYFTHNGKCKGIFADGAEDAATYMIYKSMDKENAKLFLKEQFSKKNWDFLEELCDISPVELTQVPGKMKMPFFIALNAPDSIFYKFFQATDLKLRDKAGNSVLLSALVHDLTNGDFNRFEFLCKKGLNPDEKNLAGFSCNDMIKFFANKI